MTFILGFIYMLVTGAVLVSMTALLLRGEKNICNRIYMILQGTVLLWCSSQIMIFLVQTPLQLTAAYLLGNIGICFVGTFWYYFAVLYADRELRGLRKAIPFCLSALHYLLVLSNGWHHLYYSSFSIGKIVHGPFFYTNVAATYLFVLMGAVILYRSKTTAANGTVARYLVVASVLVPVLLNVIYLSGLIRSPFDITPLGFAISIILVTLATVKYQFMDLTKQLAITNEKLLLEKERNRIAQQVHDTAGHTLTMIQSYMKLTEVSIKNEDAGQAQEYLSSARLLTSQGIRELRESINQLRREETYELVTQGIMQLADQVKEIPVVVTLQGEDSEKYSHLSGNIYDTVRESITNALKYSSASKIEIIIRFQDNCIELVIGDDGSGCAEIKENNGIRGIRERVEQAGGTVRFLSAPGEGFLTRIKLPL